MKTQWAGLFRFLAPIFVLCMTLLASHLILCYSIGFPSISPTKVIVNYLLLIVLFTTGEAIAFTELSNGKKAFQATNKKTLRQRFFFSLIFVLISSSSSNSPFWFSLHFLVPYVVFSLIDFYRIKQLAQQL